MCLMFMHYYPATKLAHCASRLSFKHVLIALGVDVWPLTRRTRNLGLRIRQPWQYQNLTFSDYLLVAANKNSAVNLKLQQASLHHSHKAECYDYGRRRIYAVSSQTCVPNRALIFAEISQQTFTQPKIVVPNLYLVSFFQDGVEFSTPRIHTPIYEVSNGCYGDTKNIYDFDLDNREPFRSKSSSTLSSSSTLAFSLFLLLLSLEMMLS